MLVERAEVLVKEGAEKDFAAAMTERGIPLLTAAPGVRSVKLGRGVENPNKFMFLVEWASMDAHSAYKTTPNAAGLREIIGPYSKGGSMEHFEIG